MSQIIRFYRTGDSYGYLSNFHVGNPIITQGHVFRTSEHLYQALKFSHSPEAFAKIRDARSARDAADLGRNQSPMRTDWDDIKDFAMRLTLLLKFEDAELRRDLIDTGDAELIEDSQTDYYWGCGKAGTGANKLGRLLMETRVFYRELDDVSPHQELAEIGDLHQELMGRLRTKSYPIVFPKTEVKNG